MPVLLVSKPVRAVKGPKGAKSIKTALRARALRRFSIPCLPGILRLAAFDIFDLLISGVNILHFAFGFFIVGMDVGVIAAREGAVSLGYFFFARVGADAQQLIRIGHFYIETSLTAGSIFLSSRTDGLQIASLSLLSRNLV